METPAPDEPYRRDPPQREPAGVVLTRVVAGVVSGAAGLLWLLLIYVTLVLSTVETSFATTGGDVPHVLSLGANRMAAAAGLAVALTLPLVFPRRLWLRAFGFSVPVFLLVTALLLVPQLMMR